MKNITLQKIICIFLNFNPLALLNVARKDFLAAWQNCRAIVGNGMVIVFIFTMLSLCFLVVDLNRNVFTTILTLEQMTKETGDLIKFNKIGRSTKYSLCLKVNNKKKCFQFFFNSEKREEQKKLLQKFIGKKITVWSERQFRLFHWVNSIYEISYDGKFLFNKYSVIYQRRLNSKQNSTWSIPIEMILGFGPLLYIWIRYRNKI